MSHPRYALPGNEELGVALERRRFGQQDRTWTNSEFGKLIGRAMAEEREDYILALYLARYAGLRIHECFRMDTAAAERALRENALTVKGKSGKVRIVPIEDDRITMMLERLLDKTKRGHKLLVPDGIPTDRAINGMQQFILRNRDAICDPTAPDRRITFHGLRHTYAAEKYTSLVDGGMTPLDAHFTVSRLLGHERLDVTDIYLASVKGELPMENKYRDLHELPVTLRVEDLRPILGIGRNTAYELIRSGQIRSVRIGRQTGSSTSPVLKAPKTESSVRKVFLPKTVSMALTEEKDRQQRAKEMLDSDYQDFGLVIAHEDGRPYEERQIAFLLRKLTDATGLPPVVFHSLRHCSASLKLQIGGGNIKAVQGDTGHAQSRMVTDLYDHTNNEERRRLAEKGRGGFPPETG